MRADTSTSVPTDEAAELAAAAGLVYVVDTVRASAAGALGNPFVYLDAERRRIADASTIDRIRKLAIPPAYSDRLDLRQCARASAGDRTRRARSQAISLSPEMALHARCRKVRPPIRFGERLPHLRRVLRRDLALPGLPEAKVLAVIVSLLAETGIRVGNEEYARSNGSYGLTTLRDRHVTFLRQGRALLRFRGKSGQAQESASTTRGSCAFCAAASSCRGKCCSNMSTTTARASRSIRAWSTIIFAMRWAKNSLRRISAPGRARLVRSRSCRGRRCPNRRGALLTSTIAGVVKEVAERLRNTPAVCRRSYIDPSVFEAWRTGRLHKLVPAETASAPRRLETIALKLLRKESATKRRRKAGR